MYGSGSASDRANLSATHYLYWEIMFSKLTLYYHTLEYLKFKQVFYRLYYFFYKPKINLTIKNNEIRKISSLIKPNFIQKDPLYFNDNAATFLNYTVDISDKKIWTDLLHARLWLYNLHYFDALNAENSEQQKIAYRLLERWMDENPPGQGIGWEAFPTSLRIINIIKYALNGGALSEKVTTLLYLQARLLNKKCEYHLLGNHLYENFGALTIAGLFFNTPESAKWFKKGYKGLQKEIKEQILNDGGHFELSPMYHGIFLEGLLDLQVIFEIYNKAFLWKNEVQLMLNWLNFMKRSNQEIAYFNDAANYIFSSPLELFHYAESLGYKIGKADNVINHLIDSGYIVLNSHNMKLICDVGNIGPDYLPGHGHADALSFELMINESPVFVNLGTSCYGNSDRRLFERGTSAHNTVVADDENSSEVWGGFRVAKRARVSDICIIKNNNTYSIKATHDGYARIKKNLFHVRTWNMCESSVEIIDNLTASVENTVAYFHLHPDCKIKSQTEKQIIIQLKNNVEIMLKTDNDFDIIDNLYAHSFGQLEQSKSIKIKLDSCKDAIYCVSKIN